jgi:hypothetical protein
MGPKYPGYPGQPVDGASWHEENPDADPFPERVEGFRAGGDARVVVLRPGEQLAAGRRCAVRGFHWPFGSPG